MNRRTRETGVAAAAALLLACGALCLAQEPARPAPAGAGAELDFAAVLDKGDEALKAEMQEGPPGDLKEFDIRTDDDVSALEVNDIYKSNASYFKVVRIRSKDKRGGKFVIQRTSGEQDPLRLLQRVSGAGPMTIAARETLMSRFFSGGSLMYPIALCMLGAVVITLNSIWIYRRGKQCPAGVAAGIRAAIASRDVGAVERLAAGEKGLLAAICRAMVADFDISSEEDIQMRCESEARRQVGYLRIPLRTLNFIAAVSPLLGLMGTVTGMIGCFDSLSGEVASASKSQMMASGIKVALLTTAFGLMVAVPALLAFFIFNQRLSAIVSDCEAYTTEFVHKLGLMKREAGADRA